MKTTAASKTTTPTCTYPGFVPGFSITNPQATNNIQIKLPARKRTLP